eukprot:COSAG05_NODE_506_length_9178_cov_36.187576_2_plen_68_part_00
MSSTLPYSVCTVDLLTLLGGRQESDAQNSHFLPALHIGSYINERWIVWTLDTIAYNWIVWTLDMDMN